LAWQQRPCVTPRWFNQAKAGPLQFPFMMKDYLYDLPPEMIAQEPLAERSASRLLSLTDRLGEYREMRFAELNQLSGGKLEILLERVLDSERTLVQIKSSKAPQTGSVLTLDGGLGARVAARESTFFVLEFDGSVDRILQAHGHVPLPPYIDRPDQPVDRDRYQTVYARIPGAVAAPTAGLHFDRPLLRALEESGIEMAQLTLHVVAPGVCGGLQCRMSSGGGCPIARWPYCGSWHNRRSGAGNRCPVWAGAAISRGHRPVHQAGIQLRRRRCDDHELSPARLVIADAGVCFPRST